MKIFNRGNKIIEYLKRLGGITKTPLEGTLKNHYYFISNLNNEITADIEIPKYYKEIWK